MLVKKSSARKLSQDANEKLPIAVELNMNRFILCHQKLNDHISKIPSKYNTVADTINTVGALEYVITSDLKDSFWQRHIKTHKLQYMAFHSPFKGTDFFRRLSQGMLNQSEGLEYMLSCILADIIARGCVRVHTDNLYVMGHTMTEATRIWQLVLEELNKNNLKLKLSKTQCFPKRLDLLGWIKEGKFIVPDPHRQNRLLASDLPQTNKQLRSYFGTYETYFKCKKNISSILKSLQQFAANKQFHKNLVGHRKHSRLQ